MKRLTTMLIILFILYFIIQILFNKYGNGHTSEYTLMDLDKKINVTEKYAANIKGETNNYYFTISLDGQIFNLQTYHDFYGSQKVLKQVKYFSNTSYKCILPIFSSNQLLFDITCLKDGKLTPYYLLSGKDATLDTFARSLTNVGYTTTNWQDNITNAVVDKSLTVFPANIIKNHYVGINNYRGLYTINDSNLKKIYNIKLFDFDVYKRPLSGIVDKYYVTADYSQKFSFNKIIVIDLTNNVKKEIDTSIRVDFDAYVQGIVDDSLYIFDRENKKQYEVTTQPLGIVEVGNVTTGIKCYKDGVWSSVSAYDAASSDIVFNPIPNDTTFTGYTRVDKVGNTLSGYYYLYQKVGGIYHVYRANVQNRDLLTYIFSTNKIDNITYVDSYVYFTSDNTVKYFQDAVGVRTLFQNSEFDFNNSLYFNIYSK